MEKKALVKIKKVTISGCEMYAGYVDDVVEGIVDPEDESLFISEGKKYNRIWSTWKNTVKECNDEEYTFIVVNPDSKKEEEYLNQFVIIDVATGRFDFVEDEILIIKLGLAFNLKEYYHLANCSIDTCERIIKGKEIKENYQEILKTIKGQDDQVKQLLSSLYFNERLFSKFKDASKFKHNILIKGSTGSGKTEMIRQIEKHFSLPITIEDATTYTVSGYVGNNIEDMFRHLYLQAGRDLYSAQRGIIVIDEIDKLASVASKDLEVKYLGVQKSLLTILEGGKMYIPKDSNNPVGGFMFDTSNVTIIGLGAFEGIEKIMEKRQKNIGTIGFGSNISEINSESGVIPQDFIDYGMMSQLIGRFSQIIEMNKLEEKTLKEILLSSEGSSLLFYKEYFNNLDINLSWNEEFVDAVAKKAHDLKCGARSLKSIIDEVMSSYIYDSLTEEGKSIELTEKSIQKIKK